MKNFLSIRDCYAAQLKEVLRLGIRLKKLYKFGGENLCLSGKVLAMVFEKPSLRTRVSFEVAMLDLGGRVTYIRPEDIGGLGRREPVKDTARVLGRYVDGIVVRAFSHETVEEFAEFSPVPVVNALTDRLHPCQAMADIMTMHEHSERLEGVRVAFIGDGNNVARSLAYASAKFGVRMVIASPAGYELDAETISEVNGIESGTVLQTADPAEAVEGADFVYTDTWVSMGQEEEKQQRIAAFEGYQVNGELLESARPGVKVMHCLPAYRGFEITEEVAESSNSIIFDQAENRLHFQRALLKKLMSPIAVI